MNSRALIWMALLMLAGCGGGDGKKADGQTDRHAADAASPLWTSTASPVPAAFGQCRACHAVDAGDQAVGPSLQGVIGRRAGTAPGFAYSVALRDSGIVWSADTLDRWLAAPMKMVPGTRMALGESDPRRREEIIAYLETLK